MTTPKPHPHGTFCWPELSSQDWAAAKDFYCALFGWQAIDQEIGEDRYYTMLLDGDHSVGALCTLDPELAAKGARSNWLSYIAVDNVDQVAANIESLGGTVQVPVMDVFDAGRMAIATDPEGARFGLWQAKEHVGATNKGLPGNLCWNELNARDAEKCEAFYTALLGWQAEVQPMEQMQYTIFSVEGVQNGGMLQMTEEWGDAPPHWMVYFAVVDCDACADKVTSLGGEVCVPPTDIPGVGRFSVLTDPQGAAFSVIAIQPPTP